MEDFVKKGISFITFDFVINRDYLSALFATTHLGYRRDIPGWSTNSTRQKIISSYWFTYVLNHFVCIIACATLSVLLITLKFEFAYLFVIFIVATITFPVLFLFNYLPNFSSHFLPILETVKELYERKQLEQTEKCRQAQLSNPALVLVYYVLDKTSEINAIGSNKLIANILMRLYGVDEGSMKKNIDLILGSSARRKNLTERKRTEMKNRFDEAYHFFQMLHFDQGLQILKELEMKFL